MSEPTPDVDTHAGDDLLAELADDFLRRHRAGEHPHADEYARKHPQLANRIKDLFPAMMAMDQPHIRATLDPMPPTERIGQTIGRYKLLERVGEGGFGVVYMAEQQQPVRRKVALKVIKPGMDSRQVLARFEAERQALAIMDHPNIAKVFDGGITDSGRPYFVMELVKGEPITSYCDNHQLPPRQRLELLAQVCHAVQHAHQKGIIHRDIKPSNVLVSLHDTEPVVKVIDFGVAKALGQELTEKTLFTGFAQLVGTPLYMSPEQAGQSALDIDTRSDIYSLGVLLYELLTGTTPFDKERFHKAAEDEIRRIIREEEPPRPSTRLSESKDSLPSISANRHTDPAQLTKLMRGELDWIVMKTLEKDRNRRYETANAFAADVLRYLNDEPVQACPPSASYRLRKFLRRNRAGVAVAALVLCFLVLLGSAIGWTIRDRTARHARVAGQVELILAEADQLQREQKWPEALAAARRAEAVVISGDADAATERRVRETLKDLEFIDRLEQIRMLLATMAAPGKKFNHAGADKAYGEAFRDYGVDVDALAVETSIDRLKARSTIAIPLATALDQWAFSRGILKAEAGWKRLAAVARGIDSDPLRDWLRSTKGEDTSEVRDELLRRAESIDIRAHHPTTLHQLGLRLLEAKHTESGLRVLRDAQSAHPEDFWLAFELAHALDDRKDLDGAIRFYTAAISCRPNAAAAHNNLGKVLRDQKKLDESIASYRRAIEIDPKFAMAYCNLGINLHEQKKLDEAIAAYRKAIEVDPKYAYAYCLLSNILSDQRKPDEAIAACRKAIEIDPKSADGYLHLGAVFLKQNKLDEAIVNFRKAVELDPKYSEAHRFLANALDRQGKFDQAIASYEKALALDPESSSRANNLAMLLVACPDPKFRDPARAVSLAQKAVELAPEDPNPRNTLGIAYYRTGDWRAAITTFEKSMALRDGGNGHDWFFLAMAHWQLGNQDEARQWFAKAARPMDKSTRPNQEVIRFRAEAAELLGLDEKSQRDLVAALEANRALTERAWKLATDTDKSRRNPAQAVALAEKAVADSFRDAHAWNTLGVARYRAGDFEGAVAALKKFGEERIGTGEWSNPFFMAMAHCQLGKKDEARRYYQIGVAWMDANAPKSQTLIRVRAEAAELLGVDEKAWRNPATAPATTQPKPLKK